MFFAALHGRVCGEIGDTHRLYTPICLCLQLYMAVFAVRQGDAYRLVFGYDSYGNTCNEDNSAKRVENVSNSGMNVLGNK